jgi:thiamine-phosphate pyrophosphorylase
LAQSKARSTAPRRAAAPAAVPWSAIGGVNLPALAAVLAAGAPRICVVSAILHAPDIARAGAEFRRRLQSPLSTGLNLNQPAAPLNS